MNEDRQLKIIGKTKHRSPAPNRASISVAPPPGATDRGALGAKLRHQPEEVGDQRDRDHGGQTGDSRLSQRVQSIAAELRRGIGAQTIEYISIEKLKPDRRNAREHPESQIDLLTSSIEQFGFIGAIITDENDEIIAGHGQLEAAKRAGLDRVPRIRVTHLTAKAKAAFALAHNRLAELSLWNEPQLAMTLEELWSADLDFSFEATGFDSVDLDRLLGPEPDPRARKTIVDGYSKDPDDEIPAVRDRTPAISQFGDIWIAGEHRILHGDARDPVSYARLLGSETAAQVVTDPPYNVTAKHISSKAFPNFQQGAGELRPREYTDFLASALDSACSLLARRRDSSRFHGRAPSQ